MYLTAHRLRSPDDRTGINAFLYWHGDRTIEWELDPKRHAEGGLGEPARSHLEVEPGGNFVDSYLDVITTDDKVVDEIEASSGEVMDELSESKEASRITRRLDDLSIRFYSSSRIPSTVLREFATLRQVALSLLEVERREADPLIIFRQRGDGESKYCLAEATVERLEAFTGEEYLTRCISVSDPMADDFRTLHQTSIVEDIALGLANLPLFEIERLGGVIVLDRRSGRVIWSSPSVGPLPSNREARS